MLHLACRPISSSFDHPTQKRILCWKTLHMTTNLEIRRFIILVGLFCLQLPQKRVTLVEPPVTKQHVRVPSSRSSWWSVHWDDSRFTCNIFDSSDLLVLEVVGDYEFVVAKQSHLIKDFIYSSNLVLCSSDTYIMYIRVCGYSLVCFFIFSNFYRLDSHNEIC